MCHQQASAVYLGKWNTTASRNEYDRLISEWLSAGRCRLPDCANDELTVSELILVYWQFAKGYYVKDGQPTGWQQHIRLMLRILALPENPWVG